MNLPPKQVSHFGGPSLERAILALDYGVQARAEAETDGATNREIIQLCDEVITRRSRVRVMQQEVGQQLAN